MNILRYKDKFITTLPALTRRNPVKTTLRFASVLLGIFYAAQAAAVPPGHVADTAIPGNAVHFTIDNVLMFGNGAKPITVGPPFYVGGPCGTAGGAFSFYACSFRDVVNNAATPYAWETAIQNPVGQGVLNARVGFFYPNGGPLLGRLTLAPNSTFHLGIIVNDAPLPFAEVGRRGIWYAWKRPGQNILTSAAVIEGNHNIPYIGPGDGVANTNGEFWYHFHSDPMDSFVVDNTLDVNDLDYSFMNPADEALANSITPVPEADTWAMMAVGLGLVGFIARRRKAALV